MQHYSMGDEIDRDTFMRYGPFHPVRVAIARQLEEAAREHETALEEAVDKAFKDGQRHKNDLVEELEREVDRRVEEAGRLGRASAWDAVSALQCICNGKMTKAEMIATAEKALAEITQRNLQSSKAA